MCMGCHYIFKHNLMTKKMCFTEQRTSYYRIEFICSFGMICSGRARVNVNNKQRG